MGIALTTPTLSFPSMGTAETGACPHEVVGVVDSGTQWHAYFSYSTTTTGTLHFVDDTNSADAGTYTWSSAFNSVNGYTTNTPAGHLFESRVQVDTGGGNGQLYSTFTGSPYPKVATWDGAALHNSGWSPDTRVWPRGIKAWNGTGLGGMQHAGA